MNTSTPKNVTTSSSQSCEKKRGYINYSTVYLSQDEVRKQGYWIPSLPIHASIVKVEHVPSHYHMWSAFLYTVDLEHGRYRWTVTKRYHEFSYLANRLLAHRAIERIKAPVRRVREHIGDALARTTTDEQSQDISYVVKELSRSPEINENNSTYQNMLVDEDTNETFNETNKSEVDGLMNLPHFPMIPDSMISDAHIEERREKLEKWLQGVLNTPINRDYHETAEFLEVSRYSFINELGGKYKEGRVKKRPGGNRVFMGWKNFCLRWFTWWGRRWLIIKDTYIAYIDPSDEHVRLVMLFDEQFGIDEVPMPLRPREFILSNTQFILTLKCKREDETEYFKETLKNMLECSGQIWLGRKPFDSSFPPRVNSYCQWFVDASDCWRKISSLIEMARDEIFITDWWLSPEVFLKRPMAEGNYWRLDCVLKRCAERGVRIFVLIYKEMEMTIGLNSSYTKKHLHNLHPNIKVIRHPDHYLGSGTFFWAHHEKLLIIDQLIAFVGGLDLCYGRWDDNVHRLTDLGSAQVVPHSVVVETRVDEECIPETGIQPKLIETQRVAQDIIEDDQPIGEIVTTTMQEHSLTPASLAAHRTAAQTPEKTQQRNLRSALRSAVSRVNRRTTAISPDNVSDTKVGIETSEVVKKKGKTAVRFSQLLSRKDEPNESNLMDTNTTGTSAKTISLRNEPRTNTLLRKVVNNLRSTKAKRRWKLALQPETDITDQYLLNFCRFQETTVDLSGIYGAGKLWPGKDYVNCYVKDFMDVDNAFNDLINRYDIPRMPWHDIHALVYGAPARDLARHFIQRWNAAKSEKFIDKEEYPYLLPKSYNSIRIPHFLFDEDTHRVDIQVVRSVAHWSSLIDRQEESIHRAYISLIEEAEHYIYIENQFFVSMINSVDIGNGICQALFDRILKAHRNNEMFRVFILIPLLPGFEGNIGVTDSSTLLAVLNWTLLSISRGDHSLIANLKKAGVDDIRRYLCFCSLRTYDELCGKLVTEIVYIHSKLMIVDDRRVIIGSANINDRSQAGNRDSEVCVVITDQEFVPSSMADKPYNAGKFAFSLRKKLMEEHLGLLEGGLHPLPENSTINSLALDDPVSGSFYDDIWCKSAKSNSTIFEEVFNCVPTNKVETIERLRIYKKEQQLSVREPELAKEKLKDIVGNLVEFPIKFLGLENLSPAITTKEGLVPNIVFT